MHQTGLAYSRFTYTKERTHELDKERGKVAILPSRTSLTLIGLLLDCTEDWTMGLVVVEGESFSEAIVKKTSSS